MRRTVRPSLTFPSPQFLHVRLDATRSYLRHSIGPNAYENEENNKETGRESLNKMNQKLVPISYLISFSA